MQDSPSLYGEEEGEASPSADDQDHGKETAVLPAELCPGMKVGDEIKLRIVSAGEDSYEVAYERDSESPGEAPDSEAQVPPSAMDSMME